VSKPKLLPEFVTLCRAITAKRPKTVIDHILKNGFITTLELKDTYGYNHPPAALWFGQPRQVMVVRALRQLAGVEENRDLPQMLLGLP
jgi:hypothetical protein